MLVCSLTRFFRIIIFVSFHPPFLLRVVDLVHFFIFRLSLVNCDTICLEDDYFIPETDSYASLALFTSKYKTENLSCQPISRRDPNLPIFAHKVLKALSKCELNCAIIYISLVKASPGFISLLCCCYFG